MITTVTMNIAIDKLYKVDTYQQGNVIRVKDCSFTAGGKGLNVARVVKALGEEVTASGLIGGHAGAWVIDELHRLGISHMFERVDGETRTCINIIDSKGQQTEFLEPGFAVSEETLTLFERRFVQAVLKSDVVTISGSLPCGCPSDYYAKLIAICHAHGKPVLLDASGERLTAAVAAKPTLIKPNSEELAQLLGRAIPQHELANAAFDLHRQGIPYVVVSVGNDGAYLACSKGVFKATPPKIDAVNVTGCGDSMLGGFAVALSRQLSIEQALLYATAISASNALHRETGCISAEQVQALLPKCRVQRL